MAFNATAVFSPRNAVINVTVSDSLILKVINNDTLTHGFDIKGYSGINKTITEGDSVLVKLAFNKEQVLIYYDNYLYPNGRYMGLAGMICVSKSSNTKNYYWNLKEHETAYNNKLDTGASVNWNNYEPDYFTINGLSYPDLQNDSTAKVIGVIGDTMHIFVANTGQSAHSIHFHGFHCKVLASNDPTQIGRVKDTFPLKSMDAMLLEMVPDKVGQYSVHDHNLVAVSGGSKHPNGMFMIMKIK